MTKKEISKKYGRFSLSMALEMFALIPLVTSVVVLSLFTCINSNKKMTRLTENAMIALSDAAGEGVDSHFEKCEETIRTFSSAQAVKDVLLNPTEENMKAAQQYTENFASQLKGWEGIYIASWDSTVVTHSTNPNIIGVTLRKDDALAQLQNAMLDGDNGLYDAGIITSPSSGELTLSLYCIVYDGNKPIGYVGGGTYMMPEIEKYSDVSALDLDTAYLYAVDKNGDMLYHADESKIGNPVENSVVKDLVAQMQEGKHPKSSCVTYDYKGVKKYASYYVGVGEAYIVVVTADSADVHSSTTDMVKIVITIAAVLVVVFIIIALLFARKVSRPLVDTTENVSRLASGDLSPFKTTKSSLVETRMLIDAGETLHDKLTTIISKTKANSKALNESADSIASLSDTSNQGVNQISTVVDELAEGATSMAQNVQSINAQVMDMGVAIDEIANGTNVLTEVSDAMKVEANDAKESMSKVVNSSEHNLELVNTISVQVDAANEATKSITQAVDIITSIASQTNLLALNASIEAARAGEAGRGFAVVAGEIKNLAEQSNSSAVEIRQTVDDIVAKTSECVRLVDEVVENINEERTCIQDTNNKFEALGEEIEVSLNHIDNIASKIDGLNANKDSIISSVSDLSAISEENAASNEEVAASITTVNANVSEITVSSSSNKTLAEELEETVSYFK